MTEGKQIKDIEDKWFKKETSCPDPNEERSSRSLGFKSFRGLFIIVGIVATLVSICGMGDFLYNERATLLDPQSSVWETSVKLFIKSLRKKDVAQANAVVAQADGERVPVVEAGGERVPVGAQADGERVQVGAQANNGERVADGAHANGGEIEIVQVGAQANDAEIVPAPRN